MAETYRLSEFAVGETVIWLTPGEDVIGIVQQKNKHTMRIYIPLDDRMATISPANVVKQRDISKTHNIAWKKYHKHFR